MLKIHALLGALSPAFLFLVFIFTVRLVNFVHSEKNKCVGPPNPAPVIPAITCQDDTPSVASIRIADSVYLKQ
jgi:hypothetical protein